MGRPRGRRRCHRRRGGATVDVLEAISETTATAGHLQHAVNLHPGDLTFTYDTGLYLEFRAGGPDDYHLAYAAALVDKGEYDKADELIAAGVVQRPVGRRRHAEPGPAVGRCGLAADSRGHR
ncbi:hypothetical protein S7W_13389 [Mycobacteroides abscessus M94]|nr:hypothetical protein S7W_13389 [Mycobacteroides abscessus M94]